MSENVENTAEMLKSNRHRCEWSLMLASVQFSYLAHPDPPPQNTLIDACSVDRMLVFQQKLVVRLNFVELTAVHMP